VRDYTPRPYQPPARDFFIDVPRGNLYADPGLGKTIIAGSVIDALGLEDVLIVAPWLAVREVWAKEFQKWNQFAHLQVVPIIGDQSTREHLLRFLPRISAVNYEQLIWLYETVGQAGWPFRHVIFDESTRLAGFRIRKATKRANALAQVAHLGGKIDTWINLTGTPNANGYDKLWGPQWFVDGGAALGRTYEAMISRWFYASAVQKGLYRKKMLLPGAEAEITQRMRSTTCTIRAKDYFDIKDPIERTLTIDLPAPARSAYNSMQRNFYAEIEEGKVNAVNCGVKAGKLRQFASGAVYYEDEKYGVVHEERLEALESIVEERSGYNLFIVYQFRHELDLIRKRFKYAVEIHEPGAIEHWNKGRIAQLLAHPKSAGHAIDLQHGGHVIVYYSPISDQELYQQVLDRLGPVRQLQGGYDRPVYIDHIVARNTVDDRVTTPARVLRKELMEAFLDDMANEEAA
jgi:SNF2 family DNA or RNA helicase